MIAILRIDLLYSCARDAENAEETDAAFSFGEGKGWGVEDIMVLIIPPVIQSCTLKQHERRGAAGPGIEFLLCGQVMDLRGAPAGHDAFASYLLRLKVIEAFRIMRHKAGVLTTVQK